MVNGDECCGQTVPTVPISEILGGESKPDESIHPAGGLYVNTLPELRQLIVDGERFHVFPTFPAIVFIRCVFD